MDNYENIYKQLFQHATFPVIICKAEAPNEVVYVNTEARIMLDPKLTVRELNAGALSILLDDLLKMKAHAALEHLKTALLTSHGVSNFKTIITTFDGKDVPVYVSANRSELLDEPHFIIYAQTNYSSGHSGVDPVDEIKIMSLIHNAVYNTADADEAVNKVLSLAGYFTGVARTYVFEDLGNEYTRNTYEWCSDGVEPAIQDLQHLRKDEYSYASIISSGLYLIDDIAELPDIDRAILHKQNISALAIVAMRSASGITGYVGFDAVGKPRAWSKSDISLLQSISNVLTSLIARRNAERKETISSEILKTVTESIDNIIYVNRPESHEIIFVNERTAKTLGIQADECVGEKCWSLLQTGMDGPCSFCPMPGMDSDGECTWEHHNSITGRWYLIKNKMIRWIDGTDVHIGVTTDITDQKNQEEQLRYHASIDSMTGSYHREWGYTLMNELVQETAKKPDLPLCLCFIDIDNLKNTNDSFGHEAGDDLIISTVAVIRNGIRRNDLIVRWGGDEFIVLIQCAKAVGERLITGAQSNLSIANEASNRPYPLSFSYGIVEFFPTAETSLEEVISTADKLMYNNKMSKKA